MDLYANALSGTMPKEGFRLVPGSEMEKEAMKRFTGFYAVMSVDTVRAGLKEVYAMDAYLSDGFKEMRGSGEIERYFCKLLKLVQECRVEFHNQAQGDGEYFFRWTMRFKMRLLGFKTIIWEGVSHVRFNLEGKVVFHHDYVDAGSLIDDIPLLRQMLRLARKAL